MYFIFTEFFPVILFLLSKIMLHFGQEFNIQIEKIVIYTAGES